MSQKIRRTFHEALRGLLRPVVAFCLRHSIKLQDFIEIVKGVFVEVAADEMERKSQKISVSRLSVMTGLHRPDVLRLWKGDPGDERSDSDLLTRVVGLWQGNKQFCTPTGRPRVLVLEGKESEFKRLVAAVSKDLNPYTVLFELERAGVALRTDNGVKLQALAYKPVGDFKEKIALLASDSRDLYLAVEENVFADPELPNLHIKTHYDNICPEYLPRIRRWFLERGAKFHAEARAFLAKFDKDLNPSLKNHDGGGRAALGAFSLTEDPIGAKEVKEEEENEK